MSGPTWDLRLGDGHRLTWMPFTCEHCGVEFFGLVRGRRRRFCMKTCARAHIRPELHVGRGPDARQWKGDAVSVKGGRTRALRAYRDIGPCSKCGAEKSERHHVDGDTSNNDPTNIAILCRRCHMDADGRLAAVAKQMLAIQPLGVVARWGK